MQSSVYDGLALVAIRKAILDAAQHTLVQLRALNEEEQTSALATSIQVFSDVVREIDDHAPNRAELIEHLTKQQRELQSVRSTVTHQAKQPRMRRLWNSKITRSLPEELRQCTERIDRALDTLKASILANAAHQSAHTYLRRQVFAIPPADPRDSSRLSPPTASAASGNGTLAPTVLECEAENSPRKADGYLVPAVRTFLKTTSATASFIPEPAGTIVKAVADTGIKIIDTLKNVESNREESTALISFIGSTVQTIVQFLPSTPADDPQLTAGCSRFLEVMTAVEESLDRIRNQGRLSHAMLNESNKAQLQSSEISLQRAFSQLQVCMDLAMLRALFKLNEAEALQERQRLFNLLGGADNGSKDKAPDPQDLLCLPGTRIEVLDEIKKWVRDIQAQRALWLNGVAGCGKTSIAATIHHELVNQHCTTSIFYCTVKDQNRNQRIIPSLARGLVRSSGGSLENHILEAVQKDADINEAQLSTQVDRLLIAPLKALAPNSPPALLVVDALDEWSDHSKVTAFIKLLCAKVAQLPPQVKILITSRDEAHISQAVRSAGSSVVKSLALDEVPTSQVRRDILDYLRVSLAHIRACHPDEDLEGDWPGEAQTIALAEKSEGLFQFAATAIRFINEGYPPDGLETVLNDFSPFGNLSHLYLTILRQLFRERSDRTTLSTLQHVLGCLICAVVPTSLETIAHLAPSSSDLKKECARIRASVLNHLGSFVIVPTDPRQPIRFLHSSIIDFLTNSDLCSDTRFYIDSLKHHTNLAERCLAVLDRQAMLRSTSIEAFAASGLQYAASYWANHLETVPSLDPPRELIDLISAFACKNLLHWMEVLARIGSLGSGPTSARRCTVWLKSVTGTTTNVTGFADLMQDASRCMSLYSTPISYDPTIIYDYLFCFIPVDSALHKCYAKRVQQRLKVKRGPEIRHWPVSTWNARVQCRILSIAYSPDGQTIISGGGDNLIRLWDAESGALRAETPSGHTGWINCVAYSPDGRLIASGADDCTIHLWNVLSGQLDGSQLQASDTSVQALVFSPDGRTLVSGYKDGTVRFWSLESREALGEALHYHTGSVKSLTFSPDGSILASGSTDMTIMTWDVATKKPHGLPLGRRTGAILSVAFSPDGECIIAATSSENAIQVWNVETGVELPLTGGYSIYYTPGTSCLARSPRGTTVATGMFDNSLMLWDAEHRCPMATPLLGHSDPANCMAFSPSGDTIVSGSEGGEIRAWDVASLITQDRALEATLEAVHRDALRCIAFTPTGDTLAIASWDGALSVWSTCDGRRCGYFELDILGDKVAFSSDGLQLRETGGDLESDRQWRFTGSVTDGDMEVIPSVEDSPQSYFPRLEIEKLEILRDGWIRRHGENWLWLPEQYQRPRKIFYDRIDCFLYKTSLIVMDRRILLFDIAAFL